MSSGTRAPAVATRISLTLVLGLALIGCEQKSDQKANAPPPAPQVTVAKPEKRAVQETDEYIGRFTPVDYVEVRAHLSGYLDAVHFKDGQIVAKGAPLFSIDRRPFQTALDQSTAALAQARANLAYAENDLKRSESLVRGSTITQQAYEQRQQAKRVAEAAVASQEAAIRQAQLDLGFTELGAPIAGRIGDRRVSVGNLVTGGTSGNTTLLATIVSVDPIRFEFTFDEASYLRYARLMRTSDLDAGRITGLPVKFRLIDEKTFGHDGHLDFVDNSIDRSSGTIRARAELPNPNGVLAPGMFAHVQIPAGPRVQALLVPDSAIGSEQARKFVLVVDAESIARPKYVTLGQLDGDLRVIKEGLGPDDNVVVNGLMRARPGAKVTPQTAAPAAATAARPNDAAAAPPPNEKDARNTQNTQTAKDAKGVQSKID